MTQRAVRHFYSVELLLCAWAIVAVCAVAPRPTLAQDGRVIVVPVASPELPDRDHELAQAIENALLGRRIVVVPTDQARERALAHARPPLSANATARASIDREAKAALEHVAFGRTAAAKRSVAELLRHAGPALESLNRDTRVARQLLDGCLTLARAAIARNARREAIEEATRCRQLVPDLAPSAALHPASVIGLVAETDDHLRRMQVGALTVESAPTSGCSVYVNGRHLGVTPLRLDQAAPGSYRVQVECDDTAGRVHPIELGERASRLVVDTTYEGALRSEPSLALVYASEAGAVQLSDAHAAQLATAVDASRTISTRRQGDGAWLSQVAADGRLLARVHCETCGEARVPRAAIEAALGELLQGKIEVLTASPVERDTTAGVAGKADATVAARDHAGQSEPDNSVARPGVNTTDTPALRHLQSARSSRRKSRRWQRGLAGSAVALGIGALVVADIELDEREDRARDFAAGSGPENEDRYLAGRRRWVATENKFYPYALLGAAAVTSGALGYVLSEEPRLFPWYGSLASAAAGVGLAIYGVLELQRGGPCGHELPDQHGCAQDLVHRERGTMLMLAAVPLLTLPLAAIARGAVRRRATRSNLHTSAQYDAVSRLSLRVVGSF